MQFHRSFFGVHSNKIIFFNIYFTIKNKYMQHKFSNYRSNDCFEMTKISSILSSRQLIFKCKICKSFFENIPFGVVLCFVAVETIAFQRCSFFIAVMKWRVFKGILLFFTVGGHRIKFMLPEDNKIDLKNESYLCNRMFATAKKESWHFKKLFRVKPSIPRNILKKNCVFDTGTIYTRFFWLLCFAR